MTDKNSKKRHRLPSGILLGSLMILGLGSCVSVESYQKMYLNDRDMKLEDESVQSFEVDFQSYREGASGGNGGKTGGGCGCN